MAKYVKRKMWEKAGFWFDANCQKLKFDLKSDRGGISRDLVIIWFEFQSKTAIRTELQWRTTPFPVKIAEKSAPLPSANHRISQLLLNISWQGNMVPTWGAWTTDNRDKNDANRGVPSILHLTDTEKRHHDHTDKKSRSLTQQRRDWLRGFASCSTLIKFNWAIASDVKQVSVFLHINDCMSSKLRSKILPWAQAGIYAIFSSHSNFQKVSLIWLLFWLLVYLPLEIACCLYRVFF